MTSFKTIGSNIRWYRQSSGLRQIDIATLAKIPLRRYQDIEGGKVNTTILTLQKISQALKIPYSCLFEFKRIFTEESFENFILTHQVYFSDILTHTIFRKSNGEVLTVNSEDGTLISANQLINELPGNVQKHSIDCYNHESTLLGTIEGLVQSQDELLNYLLHTETLFMS